MISINVMRHPSDLDLSYVERRVIDKHRTFYALLFEEKQASQNDSNHRFTEIFKRFWHKDVLNVVALFHSSHLNCLTYSPFADRFLVSHSLNVTNWRRLFDEKLHNMNGREFRVALYHERARAIFKRENFQPSDAKDMLGIDGIFTPIAMHKLNATLRLIQPTDGGFSGEVYPNGSMDGVLGLVLQGKAEASFNMRGIYPRLFKHNFESTYQKLRDDICIGVPRRGIASNIGNTFYPFDGITWTLIVLMVPIFTGLYAFLCYRYVRSERRAPVVDIFFHLLAWNLCQTRARLPRNTFSRIMVVAWITYCFIITSSYHGNVMNSMLQRHRLPEINTIQELDAAGYHVLTLRRYIPFIREYLDYFYSKETLANRIHASTTDDHYKMIGAHDTRYAYANKAHILKHAMRNVSQREVFYIMTECPLLLQQAYLVRYGSVFKGRLNWIVRQFQDAGIFTMWQNYMRQMDPPPLEEFKTTARVAFSLYNLQTTFYVLLLGYFLATFVFFVEISVVKWIKPRDATEFRAGD